jgi:hypothetical protein
VKDVGWDSVDKPSGSRRGKVAVCCEHCNEISGSVILKTFQCEKLFVTGYLRVEVVCVDEGNP